MKLEVTGEVAETLKYYVYVYIDPRTTQPFYIGKGKGNRIFAHIGDPAESRKVQRIEEIRAEGLEPKIDILRYGLSEGEAFLVEAAAIDLIGKQHLTNEAAGHHHSSFGRITCQEVILMLTAKPVVLTHKALLITINRLYRSDMAAEELYEATRGVWKIGPRRDTVEIAMAVYQGVVREVYRIKRWLPGGTLKYVTRPDAESFRDCGRWEFEGEVAQDIRDQYVNFSVGKSGQNPIRYAP